MSSSERIRVLLTGVGGQGVVTAAQILGQAAKVAGFEVVMGQLHGMSQRGGSVESSVLIGPGQSAFIAGGEADVVVAFEPLEGLRARSRMSKKTKVLVNEGQISPFMMTRTGESYPELKSILADLRSAAGEVTSVGASEAARAANIPRTLNMIMLGTVSALGLLPFDREVLLETIDRYCPAPFVEANRQALALGIELYGKARIVEDSTQAKKEQERRDELQDRH